MLGTEKTQPDTVQDYSRLDAGDTLTSEELTRVERRLLATGLFQEVHVSTQPTGDGRVKVVLQVQDKASWVVAPTFSVSNSNIGGGVLYAESNLWGRSKKFAAAVQVSTAESGLFVGFLDPNLFGFPPLRLSFEGQLRSDRVEEYQPGASYKEPVVQRRTRLNSASAASELSVMIAERVRVGAKYRLMLIDAQEPSQDAPVTEPAFEPGPVQRDASLRLLMGIDTRQNLHAIMEGLNIEGSLELSNPGVGSQFRLQALRAAVPARPALLRGAQPGAARRSVPGRGPAVPPGVRGGRGLTARLHLPAVPRRHPRILHGRVPLPALHRALAVLPGRGLLGHRDADVAEHPRGPAAAPDVTGRVVRGYLEDAHDGVGGATVAQGLGLGLRLFLRSVVLPLVGVDVAYGVNSGEIRFYLVAGVTPS